MRYQTEIFVLEDRYVCIQLPAYVPEGQAFVTVSFPSLRPEPEDSQRDPDSDPAEVEWWDEFDEEGDVHS
jgi:hypothetical protein